MKKNSLKKVFLYLNIFFIFLSLTNCKTLPLLTSEKNNELYSLFETAMQEAENPNPQKIVTTLDRIEGNKHVIDTLINNERYVKMVSWKSDPKYYPITNDKTYNTGVYDIWVTIAPILKDSCTYYYENKYKQFDKKTRFKKTNLRLRQLLGLQPNNKQTFFLEVWIKPSDLFRPCPDNEIDDTQCDLNMPNTVTSEYRKWFNDLRANQYSDCNDTEYNDYGYPWTQLGYTYDWSSENPSHVGLSEFVIKRNTIIYIRGKYPTINYCSNGN